MVEELRITKNDVGRKFRRRDGEKATVKVIWQKGVRVRSCDYEFPVSFEGMYYRDGSISFRDLIERLDEWEIDLSTAKEGDLFEVEIKGEGRVTRRFKERSSGKFPYLLTDPDGRLYTWYSQEGNTRSGRVRVFRPIKTEEKEMEKKSTFTKESIRNFCKKHRVCEEGMESLEKILLGIEKNPERVLDRLQGITTPWVDPATLHTKWETKYVARITQSSDFTDHVNILLARVLGDTEHIPSGWGGKSLKRRIETLIEDFKEEEEKPKRPTKFVVETLGAPILDTIGLSLSEGPEKGLVNIVAYWPNGECTVIGEVKTLEDGRYAIVATKEGVPKEHRPPNWNSSYFSVGQK